MIIIYLTIHSSSILFVLYWKYKHPTAVLGGLDSTPRQSVAVAL